MYKTYNARPVPRPNAPKPPQKWPLLPLLLLLLVAGYSAYALLKPLPDAKLTLTPPVMPAQVRVNVPWPHGAVNEQSAYGAVGYGLLASSGPATPMPTASIAKVITALAVLSVKPLVPGEQGPSITFSQHDVDLYYQYAAQDGSVVPVYAGESVSEYQALQAMMLPSANNIADSLAAWAFGSPAAYTGYANKFVKKLGMSQTTVTDASGFAPTTLSTPSDLVRLGLAAMGNPVLADITSQKSAEFPDYGEIENVNAMLGRSGIRGIKTGNTDQAGGCFLAAADVAVGKQKITVVTAVMDAPSLADAMRGSLPLVQSAPSLFQTINAVLPGQSVGQAATPWGSNAGIIATKGITVTAWNGTAVAPKVTPARVTTPAAAHAAAGKLSLDFNGQRYVSNLELAQPISAPSAAWRLAHPF